MPLQRPDPAVEEPRGAGDGPGNRHLRQQAHALLQGLPGDFSAWSLLESQVWETPRKAVEELKQALVWD